MIYCRECGKQISDEATVCPGCGAKQHHKLPGSSLRIVGVILLIVIVGGYFTYQKFFEGKRTTLNIPEGTYMLVPADENSSGRFVQNLDKAALLAKGLGNEFAIKNDTLIAMGLGSKLITAFTGGSQKFSIAKDDAGKGYMLGMPGDDKILMELTAEKNIKLTLANGDSLIYQRE